MLIRKKWLFSLAAGLLIGGGFCASAQDYWRVVQPQQIKGMSTFERAQYTKAMNLLNKNENRAAASEFERFLVQYKNAKEVLPYIVFLHAYSLHCAKDRNKAISVYNEVLDFYPDEVAVAAPALYYRGVAHFDNGDYAKGMLSMKELMDDEEYCLHPVAAHAAMRLVENHFRNKELDKASKYLQQIDQNFRKTSPQAAENARNTYIAYAILNGKRKEYTSWYMDAFREDFEKNKKSSDEKQVAMTQQLLNLVLWNHWNYFNPDRVARLTAGKKSSDPFKEAWIVLTENKDCFMRTKNEWSYYINAIHLLAERDKLAKKGEFSQIIRDLVSFISKEPDDEKNKGRQQKRYVEVTDLLINKWRLTDAAFVNSRITSPKTSQWNQYRIYARQDKWEDALKHLDAISNANKGDAEFYKKCRYEMANILKDKQKKYDDAIKIYRELSDPPRTLWEIVDCNNRKGDLQAAIRGLIEIENAFPNEGPEAAWRRAQYQDWNKNSEQAVKECRHIMKKYPKSRQSSAAHQMLEKYGIDTGGAVADEI